MAQTAIRYGHRVPLCKSRSAAPTPNTLPSAQANGLSKTLARNSRILMTMPPAAQLRRSRLPVISFCSATRARPKSCRALGSRANVQKFRNLTTSEEDSLISTLKGEPRTGFPGRTARQDPHGLPRPSGRESVKMPRRAARLRRFHPLGFQPACVVKASKNGVEGTRLDGRGLTQVVPVCPRRCIFPENAKHRDSLWRDAHYRNLHI